MEYYQSHTTSNYCAFCGVPINEYGTTIHYPHCPQYQPQIIPPPIEYGWCCPKCGRVYAPCVWECMPCNLQIINLETTTMGGRDEDNG